MVTTVLSSFIWNMKTVSLWTLIYDVKIEILIFAQTETSDDAVTTCSLQYAKVSFEIWAEF